MKNENLYRSVASDSHVGNPASIFLVSARF